MRPHIRVSLKEAPPAIRQPIFIIGVRHRCGTNYLKSLLCLHPECFSFPIHEDYLLAHSNLLLAYTAAHHRQIEQYWSAGSLAPVIQRALGNGLVELINQQDASRRAVLKTPVPLGLENFPALFPRAHLILLVRDGRSVTDSLVKLGFDFNESVKSWVAGAERILGLIGSGLSPSAHHRLIRYEDLYLDTRGEMTGLLAFLGLTPESYPFGLAEQLPVIGSSYFANSDDAFTPKIKTGEFQPPPPVGVLDTGHAQTIQQAGFETDACAGVRAVRWRA